MSDNKLVLIPKDPSLTADAAKVSQLLVSIEFVEPPPAVNPTAHHIPGRRFLDLLPFTPPPRAGALWAPHTVQVLDPSDEIKFLGAANTDDPTCPSCASAAGEWGEIAAEWYEATSGLRWSCASCGERIPIWELDWHRTCGFGRQSVDVWHVSAGGAEPSVELIGSLKALGLGPWDYFYYVL